MSSNESYADRVNVRFEEVTARLIAIEAKVDTLTLQVQRLSEALNVELPYSRDEHERRD